jgi:hypothetical protein
MSKMILLQIVSVESQPFKTSHAPGLRKLRLLFRDSKSQPIKNRLNSRVERKISLSNIFRKSKSLNNPDRLNCMYEKKYTLRNIFKDSQTGHAPGLRKN